MDKIDSAIIDALRLNARLSISELARRLSLSRSTVSDHLTRLEDSGVIAGYGVRLADGVRAAPVRAHVMLKISARAQTDIVATCRRDPSVTGLYVIAGAFDLIAVVEADSLNSLDVALDRLRAHSGVESTQSSVILGTKFER